MKFKRGEEEEYTLQVIPLIDVMFFLLIFFMISTEFINFSRQVDIELPESNAGATAEKNKVVDIEITSDGKLLLNGHETTMDALPSLVRDLVKSSQSRSAVVSADRRVKHGDVVKILGICKEASITDIGVAVK